MTPIFILTLSLLNATPSASTLAAVAVFAANVDRQWPADDRAPVVTDEALRLMAVATRAVADDLKVNQGKLHDAIDEFVLSREALQRHKPGDPKRPELARKALDDGREMLEQLVVALRVQQLTAVERAALKKFVKNFDEDRPVQQQADDLEQYFQQAATLLRKIVDAPPATTD